MKTAQKKFERYNPEDKPWTHSYKTRIERFNYDQAPNPAVTKQVLHGICQFNGQIQLYKAEKFGFVQALAPHLQGQIPTRRMTGECMKWLRNTGLIKFNRSKSVIKKKGYMLVGFMHFDINL